MLLAISCVCTNEVVIPRYESTFYLRIQFDIISLSTRYFAKLTVKGGQEKRATFGKSAQISKIS